VEACVMARERVAVMLLAGLIDGSDFGARQLISYCIIFI